jgi:peptidoglycan hydrolase CwlO-like protein
MVSKLFEGLQRPTLAVKLDTTPIDSFLERLLAAVKATDEEMKLLRDDNQKLNAEVASLRAQVRASDIGDLREQTDELKARVKSLEEKLKAAEGKIATKAEQAEIVDIRERAETAAEAASSMQTEFTSFQIENTKWTKGVDGRLNGLQSSLNDQISMLSEQKANKVDMVDLKQKVDAIVKTGDKVRGDMDALQRLVNEFVSSVDAKIAHKVDLEQLNDKMGRLETDDLLNQITNQLTEKLRKTGKEMQELREDLDVILTMIMQDANVGAGMLKCLSCERPVALHRPGPPPGSGREPVITQGTDKMMYRANKDDVQYSPRWASSSPAKNTGVCVCVCECV